MPQLISAWTNTNEICGIQNQHGQTNKKTKETNQPQMFQTIIDKSVSNTCHFKHMPAWLAKHIDDQYLRHAMYKPSKKKEEKGTIVTMMKQEADEAQDFNEEERKNEDSHQTDDGGTHQRWKIVTANRVLGPQ